MTATAPRTLTADQLAYAEEFAGYVPTPTDGPEVQAFAATHQGPARPAFGPRSGDVSPATRIAHLERVAQRLTVRAEQAEARVRELTEQRDRANMAALTADRTVAVWRGRLASVSLESKARANRLRVALARLEKAGLATPLDRSTI
jgi:hypothetical protein